MSFAGLTVIAVLPSLYANNFQKVNLKQAVYLGIDARDKVFPDVVEERGSHSLRRGASLLGRTSALILLNT